MTRVKNSKQAIKETKKKPEETTKLALKGRKPKSSVTVTRKKNVSMQPLKYDESYREYIIPPDDDAVIRFPIYMGSGEIRIAHGWDGELVITPPPHCAWDIEVKADDGHTESDPPIFYTRKVVD